MGREICLWMGTVVRMARYPSDTPYLGPSANYDDQIDAEQLLKRIVYGRPRPLLEHRSKQDDAFFGRLLDALSNAHAVLVKVSVNKPTARNAAATLRKELPADLFSVAVRYNENEEDWEVVAYNRVRQEVRRRAARVTENGPVWVTVPEAARVLRLSHNRVTTLIQEHGLRHRRVGGRNQIFIRQRDLAILANRPRRWQIRKKAA